MKRYIKYILTFVLFSCAVSCTVDDEIANPNDGGQMVLRLASSTMTRADNDNSRNEDKLVIADLYLFKTDADGKATGNSQWHKRVTFNSNATDLDYTATSSNGTGSVSNLKIDNTVLTSVFGTDGKSSGMLYVIANYDKKVTSGEKVEVESLPDQATLEELQKIVVATAQWGPSTEGADWADQSSFVMDGIGTVTKNGSSVGSEEAISLTRAAAKIELTITGYTDKVEYNGATWSPVLDHATVKAYVTMNNSVTSSYVGAAWDGTYTYDATTKRYGFTTATRKIENEDDETSETVTVYPQANPFYSYSSDWSGTDGANKASLLLAVPWKNNETDETKHSFYEIPIGSRINDKIERNKYYKIDIFVGTLGSFEESKKVTLTPNITVVDWSTGQIDVYISEAKYLVVDETDVKIYNKTEYYIPYASSHTLNNIEIVSVTKPNYSGDTATSYTYEPGTDKTVVTPTVNDDGKGNTAQFELEVDEQQSADGKYNGVIKLSHTLVNDNTSDAFDYVPYTITVKVTNACGFTEEIIYKQYPAIYIENHLNSSKTNVDKWSDGGTGTNGNGYGYVMVNTLYKDRVNYYSGDNWQTVESFDSNSKNPNMYIVTTTALDSSLASKYILGDSREESTYSASEVGFTSIEDVNGKTLAKYHPTKTDNENYLSPKFRIASAYGQLGSNKLSRQGAKNRCASYQEDGFPAGRWRLATTAELSYIAMLCAKGALPISLFGGSEYWSATNAYSISTRNGTISKESVSSAYLRCVYDDWYWGNEQLTDKTKYVWGDENSTAELNAKISQTN